MEAFEKSLIVAASLIVLSVLTSKASSRLGIPALLLFLIVGMGASDHGLGNIHFSNYVFAQELGAIALAFILFSGGMNTELKEVKPVLRSALILSTLGVIVSTALVGIFAWFALGFSWLEGALLGATISSTDVAAVFTVLRSKNVSLKEGLAPLLELESALNDPMAVFLGVALLGMVENTNLSPIHVIPLFFQQMILGSIIGWGSGKSATWLINRIKLEFEGLYPVLNIGWILLTYAFTQRLGGSGFLAVYISGIIIGRDRMAGADRDVSRHGTSRSPDRTLVNRTTRNRSFCVSRLHRKTLKRFHLFPSSSLQRPRKTNDFLGRPSRCGSDYSRKLCTGD
jgi:cell volume regulation protein A